MDALACKNLLKLLYMVFCLFPDKADSCTINDVTFLKQFEVITVNSSGQLKVFDLRQTDDDPTKSFSVYVSNTPLLESL